MNEQPATTTGPGGSRPGLRHARRSQHAGGPRRPGALWTAVLVTAILAVTTPASSWGAWSATAPPLTAGLNAATVPAPSALRCETRLELPIVGPQYVRLSWSAASSGATYVITVRNPSTGEEQRLATTTATTYDIRAGLLDGLVGSLLELLLNGGTAQIHVRAEHTSGWLSAATQPVGIKRGTLLGAGLLGGVQCA